jgi:hypothetical protein
MSEGFATSRRQFFAAGAVAVAALPGASSIIDTVAGKPLAMQDLASWKAHVGKQFVLDGSSQVKLISVVAGGRQPSRFGRSENFSAIFELDGPAKTDGTFTIAHAELGSGQLYMQPGKGNGGKPTLYAAFS